MAFSKAKLLRFNDVKTCAPPPGAYNPKFEDVLKTPGNTPNRKKVDQAFELPSPASSSTDVKSVKSCIPSFRTPSVPKRKKLNLFNSVGKKSTPLKLFSPEKEELREKIVECKNKDETIIELESQVEELKSRLNNLSTEKESLIVEKTNIAEQLEENILRYNHIEAQLQNCNIINEELSANISLLKEEIKDLNQYKDSFLPLLEEKFIEKTKYCNTLEDEIRQNQLEIVDLKSQYAEEILEINLMKKEALEELEKIQAELKEAYLQIERTAAENEDLRESYEFLQKGLAEIKETQNMLQPLLQEKLNLQSYIASLEQKLQEKEEEIVAMKSKQIEVAEETKCCNILEDKIKKYQQEIIDLKSLYKEEINNINLAKNEAIQELERVQTKLEEANTQIECTVLENEDLKESYEFLKKGLDEVKETQNIIHPLLQEKLDLKISYSESLEQELQEKEDEIVELKLKQTKDIDNINLSKNKALNELKKIQAELKEANCQIEHIVREKEDLQKSYDSLKEELNKVKGTPNMIHPFLQDKLEFKISYSESLEQELEEKELEIAEFRIKQIEEMENINLAKNKTLDELVRVRAELEEANLQIDHLCLENEDLRKSYVFLQKGLEEVKETQNVMQPFLQTKLDLKTTYSKTLEQELVEKEEELAILKNKHIEEIKKIETKKLEILADYKFVQAQLDDTNKQLMHNLLENDLKETYEILEESEFKEVHVYMKSFVEETRKLLKETEIKLENKTRLCEEMEKDIEVLKKQYEHALEEQIHLQKYSASNVDYFKREYQTEIEDLEYELLKAITESQRKLSQTEKQHSIEIKEIELDYENLLQQIKNDYEIELSKLRNDTDAQIRQSEENCSEKIKLAEIQMEENCKEIKRSWEMKLAEQESKSTEILKECQAIAEFSIIQCEVEKNEIKKLLQETGEMLVTSKLANENLLLENSNLKRKMAEIIIELNDARAKLGSEINLRQKDLERTVAEKHCYEITLNKTYNTVNALKTRLLHSDRDVEQLKEELENLESSKLEIEYKYSQLNEEIQHIYKINEHLKCENLLLKEIQDKVIVLERDLLEKVDNLKLKSNLEIAKLNKTLDEKDISINELTSYIQNQQKLLSGLELTINDAKNEIERQETEFIDYKFKINRLESSLNSSNKELLIQRKILENNLKHIDELEEKLNERDMQIDEITDTYKKYVETTKHLADLPQKYELLNQKFIIEQMNKNEYEDKLKQQNKLIEKMKQEIAHLSKTRRRSKSKVAEKENLCSPVRTQIFNTFDSPGSPLKERN